jgi:ribonuclease P protein component
MNSYFPKLCRLRKSWEYQQVWKMGCRLHTPHFILLLAENTAGCSRLGLTVSRKVGNAVMRNRVKRLLREFFRVKQQQFSAAVDLSIVAKRGAAQLSTEAICSEIQRALQDKGYLNG